MHWCTVDSRVVCHHSFLSILLPRSQTFWWFLKWSFWSFSLYMPMPKTKMPQLNIKYKMIPKELLAKSISQHPVQYVLKRFEENKRRSSKPKNSLQYINSIWKSSSWEIGKKSSQNLAQDLRSTWTFSPSIYCSSKPHQKWSVETWMSRRHS